MLRTLVVVLVVTGLAEAQSPAVTREVVEVTGWCTEPVRQPVDHPLAAPGTGARGAVLELAFEPFAVSGSKRGATMQQVAHARSRAGLDLFWRVGNRTGGARCAEPFAVPAGDGVRMVTVRRLGLAWLDHLGVRMIVPPGTQAARLEHAGHVEVLVGGGSWGLSIHEFSVPNPGEDPLAHPLKLWGARLEAEGHLVLGVGTMIPAGEARELSGVAGRRLTYLTLENEVVIPSCIDLHHLCSGRRAIVIALDHRPECAGHAPGRSAQLTLLRGLIAASSQAVKASPGARPGELASPTIGR